MSILDSALPPRLRSPESSVAKSNSDGNGNANANANGDEAAEGDGGETALTPREVALVLLRAHQNNGLDILCHLGVQNGRWNAVSWLVSHIVNNIWKGGQLPITSLDTNHNKLPGPWSALKSLHQLTADDDHGVRLELPLSSSSLSSSFSSSSSSSSFSSSSSLPLSSHSLDDGTSLDALTIDMSPLHRPLESGFSHNVLGIVWMSLGNMIIADASRQSAHDSSITPQILEIIALLHHCGIMPASIYSYQPSDDANALRQPPTLHLLSSHILTSLTDAAWRAHESLVVEEARAKGGEYLSMRPEIPGSMYRVHVAGLGHEVWLELVLWSCLHGGWIAEGASILKSVFATRRWRLLSWRELAGPVGAHGGEKAVNWDDLRYRLNAGTIYGDPALTQEAKRRVKRTLSSEVIAAFVDALLDTIRTNVGARGVPAQQVLQSIAALKTCLDRNKLSLGSSTWDVVLLRFFESQGFHPEASPRLAEQAVRSLAADFGDEIGAANAPSRNEPWQSLPQYALDGTAITIGLMHRVLHAYIMQANLPGALRAFEELQRLTDRNKQESITAFFEGHHRFELEDQPDNDDAFSFESHLTGIEYPAFFPQLPVTMLAPFLDLITESRAFEFGRWLLQSEDIDGPIITEAMYDDRLMGPALVRFAMAIEDMHLLRRLLEKQSAAHPAIDNASDHRIPPASLAAFLHTQIRRNNWDGVDAILHSASHTREQGFGMLRILTALANAVLRGIDPAQGPVWHPSSSANLDRAFSALFRLAKEALSMAPPDSYKARTLLILLGSIDKKWADFIVELNLVQGGQVWKMSSTPFNQVLDGVLRTYGSEHGKRFLGRLWRAAIDDSFVAHDVPQAKDFPKGVERMPSYRPTAFRGRSPTQVRITLKHPTGERHAALHGEFEPDVHTVTLVLRKALQEQPSGSQQECNQWTDWARRLLRLLGMQEQDVSAEIDRVVSQVRPDTSNRSDLPNTIHGV